MLPGYISAWTIPAARVLVGFTFGVLLAFLGGMLAAFFNFLSDYPFDLAIHKNIMLVGIGLGAGAGTYLAWMNLRSNPRLRLGILLLVLIGSTAGTYIGHFYGPGVDAYDVRQRKAIDTTIHLGAAAGGIIVATTVGLISQVRPRDRFRPRVLGSPSNQGLHRRPRP